mgnify:CR=1 FL=1
MKTKIVFFGLIAFFFISCKSARFLPSYKNIDINEYGSFIKVTQKKGTIIKGELIAINSEEMLILTEDTKECLTLAISEVNKFKLRYAQPKNYGWSVPAFIILPFIHGAYSAITIPVHLIVTISVTVAGDNAFVYNDKNMTYEKLRMFTRFPQGVPPNIDLSSLK